VVPTFDTEGEETSDGSRRAHYDVSLADLVHAGLLTVGNNLFMRWRPRGGDKRVFEGTITEPGEIEVFGKDLYQPELRGCPRTAAAGSDRRRRTGG